ncbi:MarR family transcriptional regulator [Saccharothrix coeruleofusca]|uniref:Uncharacterized protein n=1 Tax=Saccharothrix coeruleofusca TaxID=33919 RepID=A0A918EFH9_9PSEU|nr:MarR family transcriptional regulator [Saccharothrix coeruleofusca]GGP73378.1 hypothetical protein GCM10010185_53620 [Saccharothrix coeruleofusca]
MTLADRVLRLLAEHPEGLTDAEIASALHVVHQHVNSCCRSLADKGQIVRDGFARPIRNRLPGEQALPPPAPEVKGGVERGEGLVQGEVVTWLVASGWSIGRVAETASRERGTDIVAERAGVRLHVEVKGFPSKSYADPRRAGEVKPTQPATQARHWFSAGLMKVLQLRQDYPQDAVALALPDRGTYRQLLATVDSTIRTMRLAVFLVRDDGSVEDRWPAS